LASNFTCVALALALITFCKVVCSKLASPFTVFTKFEQTTLQNVISARASATQVKLDANDLSPEKIQQYQAAQGQLSQALGKLLMVTENYPNLRANDAFRGLQTQLEGTENRIKVARNDFNDAVAAYNVKARTFPNNIFAGMFGFKTKEGFKAEAGSEKAPEVKF